MLKPYTFRTQCLLSHRHPIPFPFNPFSKSNFSPRNSILLPNFLPQTQQPIACARKNNRRGWSQASNRKMLELASMIAFNLKILPEPWNFLISEIARGDWNGVRPEYLNRLGGSDFGGWRGKKTKKRRKLVWFVFVLICVAALFSWRISELDLFLKALLFCFVGISSIRLCWGKKAIKEWFLGFFFGIVLMMNLRLGKEDVKFWVVRLGTCSPVAQIVVRNRNRNGRISK